MAALRRRGLKIQPFKVGPDYIDPGYHTVATGVPSRNLDSWMVPPHALLELFHRASHGADLAVIEGVMGLFDGASGLDEAGSTAQIAKLLGAPVLLVMNAGKMARSAAAMALGYARFDPDLRIGGFLLNQVGSESHYRLCKEAIEATGVGSVLGYLPADRSLVLPERHLGLVPTPEQSLPTGFLDRLVGLMESQVDLEAILNVGQGLVPCRLVAEAQVPAGDKPLPYVNHDRQSHSSLITHHTSLASLFPAEPVPVRVSIGVARDEAFNFYYQDNLDLLAAHGARLVPFSPLRDAGLPAGIDALYIGGGFPELFAAQLAGNRSMLDSVRRAVERGMPVYGECGGLMFLCQGIVDLQGVRHPMVGAVPGWCTMEGMRLTLGYREVESRRPTPLGPAGTVARGHEFHWSHWDGPDPSTAAYQRVNHPDHIEGYARGNLLASFIHLHFGANPDLAPAFVESAASYRRHSR